MNIIRFITVSMLFVVMIICSVSVIAMVGPSNWILVVPIIVGCGLAILYVMCD